jgi:hypothetical protein
MGAPTTGQTRSMVVLVIVVFLIAFAGVAYGAYSRRGSEISEHPLGEESTSGAPGAARDDTGGTPR